MNFMAFSKPLGKNEKSHPEQSEGSLPLKFEILRFAQNDK